MEIKIDLHDVLRDEYGSMESFGETVVEENYFSYL